MLKKIMLLSVSFAMASFAMDSGEHLALTVKKHKAWVLKADKINVHTGLKVLLPVEISDTTTLADVKQNVHDMEGIPTEQQALFPLVSNWKTLWLAHSRGDKLTNEKESIKDIMSRYNTNHFILLLSLKKANSEQK